MFDDNDVGCLRNASWRLVTFAKFERIGKKIRRNSKLTRTVSNLLISNSSRQREAENSAAQRNA